MLLVVDTKQQNISSDVSPGASPSVSLGDSLGNSFTFMSLSSLFWWYRRSLSLPSSLFLLSQILSLVFRSPFSQPFGQRPRRGRCPVEHRGLLFVCPFVPPGPLRPEICPLRPKICPLKPEICPLRPWICEGRFKAWEDRFQAWESRFQAWESRFKSQKIIN